jgi:hypothetical protein
MAKKHLRVFMTRHRQPRRLSLVQMQVSRMSREWRKREAKQSDPNYLQSRFSSASFVILAPGESWRLTEGE